VAALATGLQRTITVAESLTGGLVASSLASADRASEWFRGGVVAYASEVKYALLAVPRGPVVSEAAVRSMAETTRRLFDADLGLAITGVGGPDPQDGLPPGFVWFAASSASGTIAISEMVSGSDPTAICYAARRRALDLLEQSLIDMKAQRADRAL